MNILNSNDLIIPYYNPISAKGGKARKSRKNRRSRRAKGNKSRTRRNYK